MPEMALPYLSFISHEANIRPSPTVALQNSATEQETRNILSQNSSEHTKSGRETRIPEF
jgi:hypothetical protein